MIILPVTAPNLDLGTHEYQAQRSPDEPRGTPCLLLGDQGQSLP